MNDGTAKTATVHISMAWLENSDGSQRSNSRCTQGGDFFRTFVHVTQKSPKISTLVGERDSPKIFFIFILPRREMGRKVPILWGLVSHIRLIDHS